MKILLTGGAGFIGSHIVETYLAAGHEVVVVDCLKLHNPNLPPQSVRLIKEDLANLDLKALLARENFDVINHHAAQVNVRISINDPAFDAEQNIVNLVRLLHAAATQSHPLKKFIFSSSGGAIYGDQKTYPTPENVPVFPESPYGISKRVGEEYMAFFARQYSLPTVVLRYANVFGPRQDPMGEAGVVSIFINNLLAGKTSTIFGDGAQTRDYVYVKDVARASLLALKEGITGTFNIGMGLETSVNTLYSQLQEIASSQLAPQYGPAIAGELRRSCVDNTLIKKTLGWQPQYTLASGLKETFEAFRSLA